MRPLDEEETTVVFEKLHKFVGTNLKHIVERLFRQEELGEGGVDLFYLGINTVPSHDSAVVSILDTLYTHSLDLNAAISTLPDKAAIAPIAAFMVARSP